MATGALNFDHSLRSQFLECCLGINSSKIGHDSKFLTIFQTTLGQNIYSNALDFMHFVSVANISVIYNSSRSSCREKIPPS